MKTENPITPVFGTYEEARVAPKYEMPEGMMPGEVAYQIVHDEAMLDGNSRLNLATFVTTWMDDYARKVMTENMDKNMIDKTEYPQTAEIERRCVNILAKLVAKSYTGDSNSQESHKNANNIQGQSITPSAIG